MNILITGGNGFIGSHLVDVFSAVGHDVFSCDTNRENGCVGLWKYLEDGGIRMDLVIHCAAVAGVEVVEKDGFAVFRDNIDITTKTLMFTKRQQARFVFFSSSEVYGECPRIAEDNLQFGFPFVNSNRGAYALSKYTGEIISNLAVPDCLIIRPFNVFGPRQKSGGAMKLMIRNALQNKNIDIYNDGKQVRSWCYISDFVQAIKLLVDSNETGVWNIGNPNNSLSVFDLANIIVNKVGSTSKFEFKTRHDDIQYRIPNIRKLVDRFDFQPKVSLEQGIEETIKWYRDNK